MSDVAIDLGIAHLIVLFDNAKTDADDGDRGPHIFSDRTFFEKLFDVGEHYE